MHRRPAALGAIACERRLCMDDVACCGLRLKRAGLQRVVGDLRGASRGAAVRAGNEIRLDGAASLAPSLGRMAQLTSLNLGGTLRASAGLAPRARGCDRRPCMGYVACCGLGRLRVGLYLVVGVCNRRAEGRRCVQTMSSEELGQRRWHRISEG